MKYGSLFALLLIGLFCQAQKDLPEPEISANLLLNASNYAEKNKYDKAIEELLKINKNDTGYSMALADLAYYYLLNEQNNEVIKTCEEGLRLRSRFDYSFLNLRGKAFLNLSKYEDALKSFDDALKLFPQKFILYHNKGLALEGMSKLNEAAECFKKSIEKNPYWAESHFQLGKIMGEQGRLVPCMLAWNFYLLLEPTGKNAKQVITDLELMTNGDYEYDKSKLVKESSLTEDQFTEVDELIRSKVALSKSYKARSKLNFTLTKQTQLMFEKLDAGSGKKGFFQTHYVPFYKEMYALKHDVAFYHFSLIIMNAEAVNKWLKKNESKIKTMASWAGDFIRNSIEYKTVMWDGKERKMKHWYYENHNLEAIGESNAKGDYIGYWEFYSKDGYCTAKGYFDDLGDKTGVWTWYDSRGVMTEESNFLKGDREGVTKIYHENGELSIKLDYNAGKVSGQRVEFFATGVKSSEITWKDGKREGAGVVYYENGSKRYEVNYLNDKLDGEIKEFHKNGKMATLLNFKEGNREGKSTAWWPNGAIRSEGEYKDDKSAGEWTYYHDNGKKKEVVVYNEDGDLNGIWLTWHQNGQPKDSGFYEKGKVHGIHKEFNTKGQLLALYEYKNDDIVRYVCYDGKGKEVGKGERTGRNFVASFKHPDGKVRATGEYVNGERHGLWVYYDRYGNVSAKENFKNGKLDGQVLNYYPFGQVELEVTYKNGEIVGYYKGYHANGNIQTEGWYMNGSREGEWWHYHPNGQPSSVEFYHAGDLNGTTVMYSATGKKEREFRYYLGFVDQIINYDTNGQVRETLSFPKGSGTFTIKNSEGQTLTEIIRKNGFREGKGRWLYPNGKEFMTGEFFDDQENGEFRSYHENGALASIRYFLNGELHGHCSWYYENGKMRVEADYYKGDSHGIRKFYYENGTLEREGTYEFGSAEGLFSYYAYDGTLYCKRLYEGDQLVSYSVLDINGKMGQMMPYDGSSGTLTAMLGGGGKVFEQEMQYGELNGKRKWYYPSGKLYMEQTYLEGKQQGPSKVYYPNGNLMEEENYFYDNLDGWCKYYYENGKLKEEGKYVMHERTGEWKEYDQSGKLIALKYYAFGDLFQKKKTP